ncbi:MAG: hypothetical protein KJ714_03995, partial [Euryarchaeota archaeon]|nr:hypothetical protein [Euryarchaeota archaeon]
KGQSVEVIRSSTFITGYGLMSTADEREHVTPYLYAHHDQFSIYNFESGMEDYGYIQLSVDTAEDMILLEQVISRMQKPHWEYTFENIVSFLSQRESEQRNYEET